MQGAGAPWGAHPASGSASAQRRPGAAASSSVSPAHKLPPPVGLARYVKINKVGAGAYGDVFKARDSVTGEIVALKRIKLCSASVAGTGGGGGGGASDDGFSSSPGGAGSFADDEDGVPATALREVMALREMGAHPNVVRLLDVLFDLGGGAAPPPSSTPATPSSSSSRSSSSSNSGSSSHPPPSFSRRPHLYLVFEYVDRDLRKLLVEEQALALRRERADAEERARRASGLPGSAPSTGASEAGLHHHGGSSGPASAASSAGLHPIYLRSFLWQLLRGLASMHARRIVHRCVVMRVWREFARFKGSFRGLWSTQLCQLTPTSHASLVLTAAATSSPPTSWSTAPAACCALRTWAWRARTACRRGSTRTR
jgi:hypothetical protein